MSGAEDLAPQLRKAASRSCTWRVSGSARFSLYRPIVPGKGLLRIGEAYRSINLAFRNAGGAPRSISWRRMIHVVLRNDYFRFAKLHSIPVLMRCKTTRSRELQRGGSTMDILCRLLIWSWLVAYWWNEYRRTTPHQAKARGQMAVATSDLGPTDTTT